MKFAGGCMESEYLLRIDFKRGTENPERVFSAMSDLIQAFREIDRSLAASISTEINSKLILEDIEAGSIIAKIKSALESIDDDSLGQFDWKPIVGNYLVKGKRRLIKFLEAKEKIESKKQIEELKNDLVKLASETEVLKLPVYQPIPEERLLKNLQKLGEATTPLLDEDLVSFNGEGEEIQLNKNFKIPQETIEEILTERIITGTHEMILKIKKPDYLGHSMWEFKYEGRLIPAKILHTEWLTNFHKQKVKVNPGDSIRATVEVSVNYDKYGEVIGQHYLIQEVLEVIPMPTHEQTSLL